MAGPSTIPRHGSPLSVAGMTPAQLQTYYANDTSLGTNPGGALAGQGTLNGLSGMLADGRAGDGTDWNDAAYIRATLGIK